MTVAKTTILLVAVVPVTFVSVVCTSTQVTLPDIAEITVREGLPRLAFGRITLLSNQQRHF